MSSSPSAISSAAVKRSRLKLVALFAVFLAPLLLAAFLYYVWQPQRATNFGQLISPQVAIVDEPLASHAGATTSLASLKGKWLFIVVERGECDEACARKLYAVRQVRLALAKDRERVERVLLVRASWPPRAQALSGHEGLIVLDARASAFAASLSVGAEAAPYIYIADPLGNVILRYGADADPKGMLKDTQRLLKASRIG